MPVIKDQPLPDGHPLKRGVITPGGKRPSLSLGDPMQPAIDALEAQIKVWGEEAIKSGEAQAVSTYFVLRRQRAMQECKSTLMSDNEGDMFKPMSAQDQFNEELETEFFAKQFQRKPFEIKVQKGEQGLSKSPTQAWRGAGTTGSEKDPDS